MATARSVKVQPATNRRLKGRLGGEKLFHWFGKIRKRPKMLQTFLDSATVSLLYWVLSQQKKSRWYFSGGLLRWELGALVVSGERVNRVESKMPGALKVSEMSKKWATSNISNCVNTMCTLCTFPLRRNAATVIYWSGGIWRKRANMWSALSTIALHHFHLFLDLLVQV